MKNFRDENPESRRVILQSRFWSRLSARSYPHSLDRPAFRCETCRASGNTANVVSRHNRGALGCPALRYCADRPQPPERGEHRFINDAGCGFSLVLRLRGLSMN